MSKLESIGQIIRDAFSKLLASPVADRKAIEEMVKDLQRALLTADVNAQLVLDTSEAIKKKALEEKVPPGISRKEQVIKIVYEQIVSLLGEKAEPLRVDKNTQYIVMLVGIQGSGKTTSVGKFANYLKKSGYSVGVVSSDTFRPGALEQLRQYLSGIDIPISGETNPKDAVDIGRRGIRELVAQKCNVIIVDTAGRHRNQAALIEEMVDLERNIKPNEVILVIDGTIGQQAGPQAAAFHQAAKIGSIIVTKLDTSAKGGGALSAVAATGAKIRFVGSGEGIEDFETFSPTSFVGRLLGMGDIGGLIERVKLAELEMSREKVESFISGGYTLEEMVKQFKEMQKLGPLKKVLSRLPIPGLPNIPEEQLEKAEQEVKKWTVIIQSMTGKEKSDPHMIDSSRTRRIARGSGVAERDVKNLLKQYHMSKKLMKSWKRKMPFKLPRAM